METINKIESFIIINKMSYYKTLKISIIGDSGVGKTSYVHKIGLGVFNTEHVPTLGVDVCTTDIIQGYILNLWDLAGYERFKGINSDYYVKSDCGIIMLDLLADSKFENVEKYISVFQKACPNKSIIIIGNKGALNSNEYKLLEMFYLKFYNIKFFNISVKHSYNLKEPLQYLVDSTK